MLNRIVLMGRLTRDPELRHTNNGTAVASFSLAVERDFKDKVSGQRTTDFIDIVAWRQTGEFVSKYFQKGSMAVVEGRLQMRDWQDRDGNKRRSAEVVADNVYFGSSRRDSEAQGGSYGNSYGGGYDSGSYSAPSSYAPPANQGHPAAPVDSFAELSDDDGELPF